MLSDDTWLVYVGSEVSFWTLVGWLNMTSQLCPPHLCCLSEVTVLCVTLQSGRDSGVSPPLLSVWLVDLGCPLGAQQVALSLSILSRREGENMLKNLVG